MPGKFAAETSVPPERTRAEIEGILRRYKAENYYYGWSASEAVVGFTLAARPVKFTVPMPDRKAKEFTHTVRRGYPAKRTPIQEEEAYEQAVRQRWRAMLLLIKAQLEAVELSLAPFEQVFLPWLVLPGGGTVAQAVLPQLPERGSAAACEPIRLLADKQTKGSAT